jgi:hypothetical protein
MKFFGLAAGGRKCKMARKDGGDAPGSVAFLNLVAFSEEAG